MSKNEGFWIKNEEFCIKNEDFCVKNEELCIKNEDFCIKNEEFCIKKRTFVSKTRDFADLDDVDEGLGPTKFIPNSHMSGRRPKDGEDNFHGVEAKSILARKGDCVMFRSDVWHRGSKNSSDRTRHMIQVPA